MIYSENLNIDSNIPKIVNGLEYEVFDKLYIAFPYHCVNSTTTAWGTAYVSTE